MVVVDSTWASINLGVTLCIDCSGIHWSVGCVHCLCRWINVCVKFQESWRSRFESAIVNTRPVGTRNRKSMYSIDNTDDIIKSVIRVAV